MILVTGGAGFVGLNVVEQLLARAKRHAGDEPLVFDTRAPSLPAAFERGDVTDREALGRLATAFGRWEHRSGVRDLLSPPTEIARIARRGGEAVFPPLGPTDYIYAPDLAAALIALLDAPAPAHRLYHLGTGPAPRPGPGLAAALRPCRRRG